MEEWSRFFLNRIREKLWVKPLLACMLSIAAALLARSVDYIPIELNLEQLLPNIKQESVEDLLKITASSMLVIATFSVSSMVSAYASAGNTATPRTFNLIVADDVSQNALSTFIGVFIFSIVALVALMNGYYQKPGRFILLSLTLVAFGVVIITFARWVDSVARLGRLGTVIDKVEIATAKAMDERRAFPTLGGIPATPSEPRAIAMYAESIGYVQHVDIRQLQRYAEEQKIHITVVAVPGTFATPDRPIAYVIPDDRTEFTAKDARLERAFVVGQDRLFDHDPRFGLVVLSEIAARALSPAVNDAGTAIEIIGTYVRLFMRWSKPMEKHDEPECNRVAVPELNIRDMFDDAFTSIARDGAAILEVQIRLQKALHTLARGGSDAMQSEAIRYARLALSRADKAMNFPPDLDVLRSIGKADPYSCGSSAVKN